MKYRQLCVCVLCVFYTQHTLNTKIAIYFLYKHKDSTICDKECSCLECGWSHTCRTCSYDVTKQQPNAISHVLVLHSPVLFSVLIFTCLLHSFHLIKPGILVQCHRLFRLASCLIAACYKPPLNTHCLY